MHRGSSRWSASGCAATAPDLSAARSPVAASVRAARAVALLGIAAVFALPLLAALPLALAEAASLAAWRELLNDTRLPGALGLSVFSASLSTLLALALALWLATGLMGSRHWPRLAARLGPMLALPHAAFAIGLAWLVAPAGWLTRLLAPLTGWDAPPPWVTVNDPQALTLSLVLVLKELPFLLWNIVALFARDEVAQSLRRQIAGARTLGYTPRSWWWRVGWTGWLPRLAWPLLAVFAYGLTVVDVALIIGPGSPPTLAVMAYAALTDASVERNAVGAAAAVLLTLLLAALSGAAWLAAKALARLWRRRALRGDRPGVTRATGRVVLPLFGAVTAVYATVALALLVLSVAGVWRFPAWLPQVLSLEAWQQVRGSASTVFFTAALALAAAASALVLCVAWLESAPLGWDRRVTPLVLLPLVLPQLLLMVGVYRGALSLGLDGTRAGLFWAHLLMCLPYVFIALAPAWRSFDHRLAWTALSLGRGRWAFWWRVKWPLLAAPLASALAIGIAVSVAQYLSTQFLSGGRLPTVTTEAVTLASGGQRTVAAAFAVLQALIPLLAFAGAHAVARRLHHNRQP